MEKKLCKEAEEYRWNFLKYASGQYPFSSDTKLNKASPGLRRAIKIVNICINSKGYLGYQILESIFQKLNIDEKAQIADYIITAFSPFDYNATTAYFGTYDKMVMVINANTNNRCPEFGAAIINIMLIFKALRTTNIMYGQANFRNQKTGYGINIQFPEIKNSLRINMNSRKKPLQSPSGFLSASGNPDVRAK